MNKSAFLLVPTLLVTAAPCAASASTYSVTAHRPTALHKVGLSASALAFGGNMGGAILDPEHDECDKVKNQKFPVYIPYASGKEKGSIAL